MVSLKGKQPLTAVFCYAGRRICSQLHIAISLYPADEIRSTFVVIFIISFSISSSSGLDIIKYQHSSKPSTLAEISMTLQFELTFKDYLEFNYYYLWARPERLGYRMANSLLPLCVLLLLMYFFKGLNFKLYGIGELAFLCLGILLFFSMPYLVKKGYSNSVRRLLESGKNLTLLGSKLVVFDNDKVTEITERSTSTVLWSGFESLKENNEYFFLFQNANQAIIIPKRALTTDIEIENLRLFIKSQLEFAKDSANMNCVKNQINF